MSGNAKGRATRGDFTHICQGRTPGTAVGTNSSGVAEASHNQGGFLAHADSAGGQGTLQGSHHPCGDLVIQESPIPYHPARQGQKVVEVTGFLDATLKGKSTPTQNWLVCWANDAKTIRKGLLFE